MRRKKNKRFMILKSIMIITAVFLIFFIVQKMTTPQWKNGNEEVITRSEKGVHEQWNEYTKKNNEQKVLE